MSEGFKMRKFVSFFAMIALFSQLQASVGSILLLRGKAEVERDNKTLEAENLMLLEDKDSIRTKKKN